jgi:hypothetical protein
MDDTLRTAAVPDAARRSLTDGVPVATDSANNGATDSATDGGPA